MIRSCRHGSRGANCKHRRSEPGDKTVELPTGSGRHVTLAEAADEISHRLVGIFLPDGSGRRPVWGGYERPARDPRWQDVVPMHEYFHADNGMGLGASHQTGWTGLVANLILER